MKIVAGIIALIAIIIIAHLMMADHNAASIPQSQTAAAIESPTSALAPHKTLSGVGIVPLAEDGISIQNEGPDNWPVVELYVNGSPPWAHKLTIPALKKGQVLNYQLRSFTKENGERFDPYRFKLQTIWIGGNGYDYEKYGF